MEASDIQKRYSGGATNNDPNASLGGEMSTEPIPNNVLQNLFDNVSSSERASGTVEYRCFYLRNNHPTESLTLASVFVASNTPSPTTHVDIGIDPVGVGDGTSTGVAVTTPDEETAPVGVDFDHSPEPVDSGTGLPVGSPSTLGPGDAIAVWVRRTVNAGTAALANDPFTIRITGDPVA